MPGAERVVENDPPSGRRRSPRSSRFSTAKVSRPTASSARRHGRNSSCRSRRAAAETPSAPFRRWGSSTTCPAARGRRCRSTASSAPKRRPDHVAGAGRRHAGRI